MEAWPVSFEECSFVFSDRARSLVARAQEHEFIEGSQSRPEELLAKVADRFREGSPRTRLFGAIPFDPRDRVRLFSSEKWQELESWPHEPAMDRRRESLGPSPWSDQARFVANVAEALAAFERSPLRKVVLARHRTVPQAEPSLPRLLSQIRAKTPNGTLFSMGLPSVAGVPHALVGVSPELLVSRRGTQVFCAPLAGTSPRSTDGAVDSARAAALRASSKDLGEHRFVVDGIRCALAPLVTQLEVDSEPSLHATEKLWHLRTDIRGQLKNPRTSALDLALALHPTAAVGGEPAELALDFVRRNEDFSRGFYAGAVGHMDASGDGEWMVAIRCAEVSPEFAKVYAGAGIVSDSLAEVEFVETEAKMETMFAALGYGD